MSESKGTKFKSRRIRDFFSDPFRCTKACASVTGSRNTTNCNYETGCTKACAKSVNGTRNTPVLGHICQGIFSQWVFPLTLMGLKFPSHHTHSHLGQIGPSDPPASLWEALERVYTTTTTTTAMGSPTQAENAVAKTTDTPRATANTNAPQSDRQAIHCVTAAQQRQPDANHQQEETDWRSRRHSQ